jgi:hypothetical protein
LMRASNSERELPLVSVSELLWLGTSGL